MTLHVSQLGKDYPTRSGPLTVLRGINLKLDRGAALAVMGPSGSGKSTLLHIMGTLERPTSGTVRVAGTDVGTASEATLAGLRARRIGFVFQQFHLLESQSALENVADGLLY